MVITGKLTRRYYPEGQFQVGEGKGTCVQPALVLVWAGSCGGLSLGGNDLGIKFILKERRALQQAENTILPPAVHDVKCFYT